MSDRPSYDPRLQAEIEAALGDLAAAAVQAEVGKLPVKLETDALRKDLVDLQSRDYGVAAVVAVLAIYLCRRDPGLLAALRTGVVEPPKNILDETYNLIIDAIARNLN